MGSRFYFKWFLLFLLLLSYNFFNAQNIGDYGAITSGTWNTAIWGVWNGTSFAGPATILPAGGTTKNVYIPLGITVTTPNTSYTSSNIGDLYVLGQLSLMANFTLTNTTKKLVIDGGTVMWFGNYDFTLSNANAYISVLNYNGSNGLQANSSCNNNKALYIGTIRYAVCIGGGSSTFLLSEINGSGGTFAAVPNVSPTEICMGSSTVLSGNYSGTVGTAPTYSWSGTGPGGYTFSSALQNPGSQTLTTPGTYTYNLTVSTNYNGTIYTNTQPVTVVVDPTSVGGTASADQSICTGSQPSNLSVTGNTGNIQWQKSTDNITFTDIAGATSSTLLGSIIGNLTTTTYFRAKITSGLCSSAFSTTVTVTINVPTITGTAVVSVGGTSQLTGSPTPALINPWVSSNPAVATVSSTGLVTGVSQGSTTITYTNNLGCKATINISVGVCFQTPTSPGVGGISSNHGITDLGRAGTSNGNWPMIRKGAYTVLEAKTKGFVITRVASTSAIANPIEGMIVYDIANDCLSIYNGTAWKCYKTQTCP